LADTDQLCVSCEQSFVGPSRRGRCNPCRNREAYHADVNESRRRAYKRAHYLKHKYGMTLEDYDRLLESQDGACAICGITEPDRGCGRFHVDHDHACCPSAESCGKCVRGLLCGNCNVGLAQFRDSPAALLKAIEYLGGDSHR
jgi:hypothetical protein